MCEFIDFSCDQEIIEDYLIANDRFWHKNHFFCRFCKRLIPNKEFFIHNQQLTCEECHFNKKYNNPSPQKVEQTPVPDDQENEENGMIEDV